MIAQEAYQRQRAIKWAATHGVTIAAIRYRMSRKTLYKWLKRYDSTVKSLQDLSRAPYHCPWKQTPEEIKLVERLSKKYEDDRLLAYEYAVNKGYTRNYGCFKRTAGKQAESKQEHKKRENKPYQRAAYPGQKIQLDVKFVPSYCAVDGRKYYRYTAKDECTRWTFRQMYDEHSTHSSYDFLCKLVKAAPFPIRLIQTDNGTEFTNALLVTKSKHKTMFEQTLQDMGIDYKRIQIATPRHNGKVERQHRTDEARFYKHMRMYNLEDGRKQLAKYQRESNDHIMTCLNMQSPNQVLARYLAVMW